MYCLREPEQKIISFSKLKELSDQLHAKNKKIVTTNGCFDLLDSCHIFYLKEARKLGDVLICGVNSDASVQVLKGPTRPIQNEKYRAYQVAGLESVDYVTVFSDPTPEQFIRIIRPKIHVKGSDYKELDIPEKKLMASLGGELHFISYLEGFSSTALLERLTKR